MWLLALPTPWVSRDGALQRASQGKGKNVAERGWVREMYRGMGRDKRKVQLMCVALTTRFQMVKT